MLYGGGLHLLAPTQDLHLRILAGGEAHHPAGRRIPHPAHPYAVVAVVGEGGSWMVLPDKTRLRFASGQVILMPPQHAHEECIDPGRPLQSRYLDFDCLAANGVSLAARLWPRPVVITDAGIWGTAGRAVDQLANAHDPRAEATLRAAAWQMIAPLMPAAMSPPSSAQVRLDPTLRWAGERLAQALTIAHFCAQARMSRQHLNELFLSATGIPPMAWLRQQRVAAAQRRLIADDAPIGKIAGECSPFDQFQFCRMFTRETGFSPSAYRQAVRAARGER